MPLQTGIFADLLVEENHRLSIEKRQSPENPSTPLSAPADWLYDALGATPTTAGVGVSEKTALTLSAVYACVRVIAEAVASLPLFVYRRLDRGKEKATTRQEYYLLHDEPNSYMSSQMFRETMTASVLLWGNAYAEIVFNNAAKTVALLPLMSDVTDAELTPSGTLRYVTTDKLTGKQRSLLAREVLHIPGLSFDGISGLSPIRYHREGIGLGLQLERFGSTYFTNGSRMGGVLETAQKLSPEAFERLKKSWSDTYGGTRNHHRVAILEQGMKFATITIPNDDAQFLETRKFQVSEIARIFRVPPHLIGDLEKATFSNIEHQSLDFVVHTLRPWLVRWEQEINRKLFGKNSDFFAEHQVDGLLRGDFKSRMEGYSIGRNGGWYSPNDILELENRNPLPGPEGDMYLVPLNMVPADMAEELAKSQIKAKEAPAPAAEEAPKPEDEVKSFARPLIADAIGRSLNYGRKDQAKLQKSVSQAFTPALSAIAAICGLNGRSELAIRSYADTLHIRIVEWEGKPLDAVIDSELDLAYQAMKEKA